MTLQPDSVYWVLAGFVAEVAVGGPDVVVEQHAAQGGVGEECAEELTVGLVAVEQ